MSVVNRALVALERRHADGIDGLSLPRHVRPVARRRVPLAPFAIALAAVAIGLALARLPGWREPADGTVAAVAAMPVPRAATVVSAPPPEPFADLVSLRLDRMEPPPTQKHPPVGPMRHAVPSAPALPIANVAEAGAPVAAPAVDALVAEAAPEAAAVPLTSPLPAPPVIDRQERPLSVPERAENAYRLGMAALQNGHPSEAEAHWKAALELNPRHAVARQALLGLLLDARRWEDAERLMLAGLRANPEQVVFAMAAARLQAQRGDGATGVATLEAAEAVGRAHADFLALFAGLLQQQGRHAEAVSRYEAALALGAPQPVWHLGCGISLRELGRGAEARAAFQRALDSGALSPELRAYAERQLGRRTAG